MEYSTEFVVREARAAELVIVGPDRTGDSYRSLDPGSLIVHAGRPVLLVPSAINSLQARQLIGLNIVECMSTSARKAWDCRKERPSDL